MKISELIEKLTAIQTERGDCDVFASLGSGSSHFFVTDAEFAEKDDRKWHAPPHQYWLPERVVLAIQVI